MEKFLAKFFTLWIVSNSFTRLTLAQAPAQKAPTQRAQTVKAPMPLPPNPENPDLWCLFCRSDKQPECINKISESGPRLTKPCRYETLTAFNQDLGIETPERPIAEPRAGNGLKWGCYRVHTIDETLTIRSCVLVGGDLPSEEECRPCQYNGKTPARCCTCSSTNCNHKNSDATRVFQKLTVGLLSVVFLLAAVFY